MTAKIARFKAAAARHCAELAAAAGNRERAKYHYQARDAWLREARRLIA